MGAPLPQDERALAALPRGLPPVGQGVPDDRRAEGGPQGIQEEGHGIQERERGSVGQHVRRGLEQLPRVNLNLDKKVIVTNETLLSTLVLVPLVAPVVELPVPPGHLGLIRVRESHVRHRLLHLVDVARVLRRPPLVTPEPPQRRGVYPRVPILGDEAVPLLRRIVAHHVPHPLLHRYEQLLTPAVLALAQLPLEVPVLAADHLAAERARHGDDPGE